MLECLETQGRRVPFRSALAHLTSGEAPLDPRLTLGPDGGVENTTPGPLMGTSHPRLHFHSLPLGVPWEGRGKLAMVAGSGEAARTSL